MKARVGRIVGPGPEAIVSLPQTVAVPVLIGTMVPAPVRLPAPIAEEVEPVLVLLLQADAGQAGLILPLVHVSRPHPKGAITSQLQAAQADGILIPLSAPAAKVRLADQVDQRQHLPRTDHHQEDRPPVPVLPAIIGCLITAAGVCQMGEAAVPPQLQPQRRPPRPRLRPPPRRRLPAILRPQHPRPQRLRPPNHLRRPAILRRRQALPQPPNHLRRLLLRLAREILLNYNTFRRSI